MRIVQAFVKKHPVLTYFGLTFAISWACVLLVIGGPAGMVAGVRAQNNHLFPLGLLAMLAGPSTIGIVLTGLIEGRRGLREFDHACSTGVWAAAGMRSDSWPRR
jgi:hypothetical protein